MVGRTSSVGDILLASVRGDLSEAARMARRAGAGVTDLPAVASFHGVGAFVHRALGSARVLPEEVAELLRDEYYRALLTRQQTLADLAGIAETLDRVGVDFAVLKGPSLAEFLYPDPALRAYNDLDLVVRPADLPAAVDALERDGHRMLDANWDLLLAERPGEIHLAAPAGTVIDLHWHLINDGQLRARMPIDVNDVLDRSEYVSLDNHRVRVLDPVDRLVFVALHACISGGDRLIWLNDVWLCASEQQVDASAVWARATQWRVRTAVTVVLGRAQRVLGETEDQVQPQMNTYEKFDSLMNRARPIESTTGRRSSTRLIARAAGDRSTDSAFALVRLVALWARRGAPRGAPTTIDRDPTSTSSPLHPSGGPASRERFLAAVASNRI